MDKMKIIHGKKEFFVELNELDLSKRKIRNISDIKGLERLTNLTRLDLSDNKISEIENLDKLKKLQYLYLGGNRIQKITGLEKLLNLQFLCIERNKISEIEGLDNLKNLNFLCLRENQIIEIKGLDKLHNLETLRLSGNRISEIKGLNSLKNLVVLECNNNYINEMRGLENLLNLGTADFNNNNFEHSPFSSEKKLDALYGIKRKIGYQKKIIDIINLSKEKAEYEELIKKILKMEYDTQKELTINEIVGRFNLEFDEATEIKEILTYPLEYYDYEEEYIELKANEALKIFAPNQIQLSLYSLMVILGFSLSTATKIHQFIIDEGGEFYRIPQVFKNFKGKSQISSSQTKKTELTGTDKKSDISQRISLNEYRWGKNFISELRKQSKISKNQQIIPPELSNILQEQVKVVLWKDLKFRKTTIDIFRNPGFDEIEINPDYHLILPPDFDDLPVIDQDYWHMQDAKSFDTRYGARTHKNEFGDEWDEIITPDYSTGFSFNIFNIESDQMAKDFISKLTRELLERRTKTPINNAKIRLVCLNTTQKEDIIKKIRNLKGQKLTDEEKSVIIAKFFYFLGFEVFPIEELKHFQQFKDFQNKSHVDVIAYYPPINTIYLIEEIRKFGSTQFYKFDTPILKRLQNFIDSEYKLTEHFIIIGKISDDIKLPDRISVINIKHGELEHYCSQILNINPEEKEFLDLLREIYKKLKLKI